jgi:hypothetical protein
MMLMLIAARCVGSPLWLCVLGVHFSSAQTRRQKAGASSEKSYIIFIRTIYKKKKTTTYFLPIKVSENVGSNISKEKIKASHFEVS